MFRLNYLVPALVSSVVASMATAQTVINSNIATSTTLTLANSPYALSGDIYVLPGATLTIEAGVQFRSTANGRHLQEKVISQEHRG